MKTVFVFGTTRTAVVCNVVRGSAMKGLNIFSREPQREIDIELCPHNR